MRAAVIFGLAVALSGCGGGGGGTEPNPRVDVGLAFEALGEPVVGQPLEVRAIVNNGGPSLLSGPTLRLDVSGDADFEPVPVGSQASITTGSGFVEWTDFFVAAGTSRSFSFTVTPHSTGTISLALSYDSGLTETNPTNDTAELVLRASGGG